MYELHEVEIKDSDGSVIRRSRNLRGILDHARVQGVEYVRVDRDLRDGGAIVKVGFWDRATARTKFASYQVAVEFVKARRSWNLKVEHDGALSAFFIPA